jgi:hypothetical protein
MFTLATRPLLFGLCSNISRRCSELECMSQSTMYCDGIKHSLRSIPASAIDLLTGMLVYA